MKTDAWAGDMKKRHILYALAGIVLIQGCSSQRYYTLNEFDTAYQQIDRCFKSQLDIWKRNTDELSDRKKSVINSVDGDHWSIKQMLLDAMSDNYAEIKTIGANTYCRHKLIPAYEKLVDESVSKGELYTSQIRARYGTVEVDSGSLAIDLYHNKFGKHYRGHSDITRDALIALMPDEFKKYSNGIRFLQQAALTPDLFMWNSDVYHAQTPAFKQLKVHGDEKLRQEDISICEDLTKAFPMKADAPNTRCRMIASGLLNFIQTFGYHYDFFNKPGNNDHTILVHVGILLHMVQDLVYHRGLTLQQHSGLSFLCGYKDDPDLPLGTLKGQKPSGDSDAGMREKEARLLSQYIIQKTLDRSEKSLSISVVLGGISSDAISNSKENANESTYTRLAKSITKKIPNVPSGGEVTLRSLYSYYKLASTYVPDERDSQKKLRDPQQDLIDERIVWPDSKCLVEKIVNGLRGPGIRSTISREDIATLIWKECKTGGNS